MTSRVQTAVDHRLSGWRTAARSREARASQGRPVSVAWSLAGACAIIVAAPAADSAAVSVIPAGLEPATYALGSHGVWRC